VSSIHPGPGLRKCPSSSFDECTARADRIPKGELEELLRAAGLLDVSQREAARQLACDEKTLRRWRHPDCGLDLAPHEIRVLLQGLIVQRVRFSRVG
jgi:hypothetical protein